MGWRDKRPRRPEPDASRTPLAPFDPGSRETLEWRQPGAWKQSWELVSGELVLARLTAGGAFDSGFTLDFADASWRIRQRWNGHLEVDAVAGNAQPARYRSGLFSGSLEREGQPRIKSRQGGFFKAWWELVTPDEELMLVRVRRRDGMMRMGGTVELSDAARRMKDLELLVGMCWVIGVVARRHAASAGG